MQGIYSVVAARHMVLSLVAADAARFDISVSAHCETLLCVFGQFFSYVQSLGDVAMLLSSQTYVCSLCGQLWWGPGLPVT
jgi:hypothetical protein